MPLQCPLSTGLSRNGSIDYICKMGRSSSLCILEVTWFISVIGLESVGTHNFVDHYWSDRLVMQSQSCDQSKTQAQYKHRLIA